MVRLEERELPSVALCCQGRQTRPFGGTLFSLYHPEEAWDDKAIGAPEPCTREAPPAPDTQGSMECPRRVGRHVGHGAALAAEPRRGHPWWWALGKREVEVAPRAPRVEGTSGPVAPLKPVTPALPGALFLLVVSFK